MVFNRRAYKTHNTFNNEPNIFTDKNNATPAAKHLLF